MKEDFIGTRFIDDEEYDEQNFKQNVIYFSLKIVIINLDIVRLNDFGIF